MIQVTMEAEWMEKYENDISFSHEVLRRMRAAGIPVIGAVAIKGVDSGRLIQERDMFGNITFTWEPGDE